MRKLKNLFGKCSHILAKKLRAMSLWKRLIALVAFLIFLPTLSINIVLYYQYSSNLEKETIVHASQYIRGVSDIVRQKLAVFENIAQSIYTDTEIRQKLLEHRNAIKAGDMAAAKRCKNSINNNLYNTLQNLVYTLHVSSAIKFEVEQC